MIMFILLSFYSARADALLDLMMDNSYIDELKNDESYTIDDFSSYQGAEWISWKLQDSDDLIIIYDDRCDTWDR